MTDNIKCDRCGTGLESIMAAPRLAELQTMFDEIMTAYNALSDKSALERERIAELEADQSNALKGAMELLPDHDWGNEPDSATAMMAVVYGEVARLREVVEKLPKTADGVVVVPGDEVYDLLGNIRRVDYSYHRSERFWIPVGIADARRYPKELQYICGVLKPSDCYSTREAAEAAKGGG